MKSVKLFTLDTDLVEKLKDESNASALVNGLVKDYYDKDISDDPKVIEKNLLEVEQIIVTASKKREYLLNKKREGDYLVEMEKKQEIEKERRAQRKEEADLLMKAWKEGRLTDEQYWEEIDRRKEEDGY